MLTANHRAILARTVLLHTISFQTCTTPARAVPLAKVVTRAYTLAHRPQPCTPRSFSTAKAMPFEFISSRQSQGTKKDTQPQSLVILSEPAWPHPVYSEKQMNDIVCLLICIRLNVSSVLIIWRRKLHTGLQRIGVTG